MSEQRGLTQECFDQLLKFLGPDPEEAGKRYEEIRRRLIRTFACRGCSAPDELADRTFDRVCEKIPEIAPGYVGEQMRYFYRVADKIFHESFRRKYATPRVPVTDPDPNIETLFACLDECIAALPEEMQRIVLDYYRGEKQALIDNRKEIARTAGISRRALRLRLYRARAPLEECVAACMERAGIP